MHEDRAAAFRVRSETPLREGWQGQHGWSRQGRSGRTPAQPDPVTGAPF